MLKKQGTKKNIKIVWSFTIICFFTFIIICGKYNAYENNKSLQCISDAKKYFDEGNLVKAKESFLSMKRKGIIEYNPQYKEIFSMLQQVASINDNKPIQILGRFSDNFIENKAYLVINDDTSSKSFSKHFLRLKGWAPKVDTLYPLNIKVEFEDKSFSTATLYQDGNFEVDVPVNNAQSINTGDIIKVLTDRYYSPKMIGTGNDPRNLSVQIDNAKVFDYSKEQKQIVAKGLFDDNWMGKGISLDIQNFNKNVKGAKIIADVPKDIKIPFNIIVKNSTQTLQIIRIEKSGENQLNINLPDDLKNSDIIQLSIVSEMTYNPKALGINDDIRDLCLNIKGIEPLY